MHTDPPLAPRAGIPSNDASSDLADEAKELVDREAAGPKDPHATGTLIHVSRREDTHWDSAEEEVNGNQPPNARTWLQELPRWLATLDSGRTRREYEKAVTYFFATPGMPDRLEALTLDLLLAYRGSLALRAERQPTRRTSSRATPPGWDQSRLGGHRTSWLPSSPDGAASEDTRERGAARPDEEAEVESPRTSPLAPATVNLRLTALRQFLAHCSLWGLVPQLSPERMRAALRRLAVERRRPYQILAEPEWTGFLEAARAPLDGLNRAAAAASSADDTRPTAASTEAEAHDVHGQGMPTRRSTTRSPWGVPRAVKGCVTRETATTHDRAPSASSRAMHDVEVTTTSSAEPTTSGGGRTTEPVPSAKRAAPPLARSTSGLTGERTAQRDYALLALALATGLRAVELSLLDLGDLSREWHAGREEWWLILPDAKTKGQRGGRTLPLAPELVQTLLDYARSTGRAWERAADRQTPLFLPLGCAPARTGRPDGLARPPRRLSLAQIRSIVDRVEAQWLATQADGDVGRGSRAISPHALRHSTAIALLEGNTRAGRPPASVEHVRGWLGHVDIRTTQGYLAHLDDRRHHRPFVLEPNADGGSEEGDEDNEN